MSQFFKRFVCDIDGYSVIIDDDGNVAYAYLVKDERIVADVWLYNQALTPDAVDWKDQSEMPFLNPKGYALGVNYNPITSESEIEIKWVMLESEGQVEAEIFFRGELFARLVPEMRPSLSILVEKDGPLAKKLT